MIGNAGRTTVGIVGFGKIARTEHVPALRDSRSFVLDSIADPAADDVTIPRYADFASMLAAERSPEAVAICTPPQARYHLARLALAGGKHVLLEKPPCSTLGEVAELASLAKTAGRTLFCAWHSRFAPAVQPARDWLASRTTRRVRIAWHEDVRVWHPGQDWIWKPGGFGVFDAGINALSIATAILPLPFFLRDALLRVPENEVNPIAAELAFSDSNEVDMTASFDWLQSGPPTWDLEVETSDGHLLLSNGGARLAIDGRDVKLNPSSEYAQLYAHFADLIAAGGCDVDASALHHVAAAFSRGRRETTSPFFDRAES